MPKKKTKYPPTKPWTPDKRRWKQFLNTAPQVSSNPLQLQRAPKDGWQLWDWRTLKDVNQNI